jgi:hypothetical protein
MKGSTDACHTRTLATGGEAHVVAFGRFVTLK